MQLLFTTVRRFVLQLPIWLDLRRPPVLLLCFAGTLYRERAAPCHATAPLDQQDEQDERAKVPNWAIWGGHGVFLAGWNVYSYPTITFPKYLGLFVFAYILSSIVMER